MSSPLRTSRSVAILLFLLAALLLIGVPAMCAIDSAYDEDTPAESGVEGVPDALD